MTIKFALESPKREQFSGVVEIYSHNNGVKISLKAVSGTCDVQISTEAAKAFADALKCVSNHVEANNKNHQIAHTL